MKIEIDENVVLIIYIICITIMFTICALFPII